MSIVTVQHQEITEQNNFLTLLYNSYREQSRLRGSPFTYSVRTYGCQLNESDSEKITGYLKKMSMIPTETSDPDVVIYNTCSVREHAQDRLFGNLGLVKAAKKKNPSMIVAVCGCMMKQDENVEKIKNSYPYVDLVFGPQDIHRIPELFHKFTLSRKKVYDVTEIDYLADDMDIPIDRSRKFRALVPIMYGCNKFCTYCIVPYTRGRERSRPSSFILDELQQLVQDGFKEIMLLGQNVNSYGTDQNEDLRFAELLENAAKIKDLYRIRFMTSHPLDMTEPLIDIMAAYPNIENHLHLPLQSGSNRILEKMNRKYTREHFMKLIHYFRTRIPEGTVSTDIIVGFPGETEEDFQKTLDLVKEAAFDSAFTFQYSKRPGTPAAEMTDQISQDIVTERFNRLLELQNDNCYRSNLKAVDKIEEVLVEGRSETSENIFSARTSANRLVNFTIPAKKKLPWGEIYDGLQAIDGSCLEGQVALVRMTGARPYSLEGELELFV